MGADEEEFAPDTKTCVMCAESIRAQAAKCIHCGSYQRWLGRVSVWTTVLSLLVALIAVVGWAAPALKSLFTPTQATLRFSNPEFRPGSIVVRTTNIGAQPAIIDAAIVTIPQRTGGQPYIFVLEASNPRSEQEVSPGETATLNFVFNRRTYDPPPVTEGDRPCTLEIYDSVREVSCDEVRYLGTTLPAHDRRGSLPEEGPAPLQREAEWVRLPVN